MRSLADASERFQVLPPRDRRQAEAGEGQKPRNGIVKIPVGRPTGIACFDLCGAGCDWILLRVGRGGGIATISLKNGRGHVQGLLWDENEKWDDVVDLWAFSLDCQNRVGQIEGIGAYTAGRFRVYGFDTTGEEENNSK
ncbi:uncharacterized protein EAE98_006485 [Botrytis deweyae]|uniref:Uncharacterized protein n=1 Tax=Botrytis deweyae TaxID=2478750 RepID=A0ABQ7IJG7_9HELO|nr:uncharacterized protein EAE98_006485 [Botrytis deweyae]KAF7926190.1 hypothetical protein EAE98_006485 [Botrytis deweyae]